MQKVMVVDDDAFTRMHCKDMLVQSGFDVAEAANGTDAIAVYEDFHPDMVLMDLIMPGIGGLNALKEIKVNDPDARVAVVIANGQQALILDALNIGAVDFVIKPFEKAQVLDTIRKALGKPNLAL